MRSCALLGIIVIVLLVVTTTVGASQEVNENLYASADLKDYIPDFLNWDSDDSDQGCELSFLEVSNITSSSAVITWVSRESCEGRVKYGLTDDLDNEVEGTAELIHSMRLKGLPSGTRIFYQVYSGEEKSGVKHFQTSAIGAGIPKVVYGGLPQSHHGEIRPVESDLIVKLKLYDSGNNSQTLSVKMSPSQMWMLNLGNLKTEDGQVFAYDDGMTAKVTIEGIGRDEEPEVIYNYKVKLSDAPDGNLSMKDTDLSNIERVSSSWEIKERAIPKIKSQQISPEREFLQSLLSKGKEDRLQRRKGHGHPHVIPGWRGGSKMGISKPPKPGPVPNRIHLRGTEVLKELVKLRQESPEAASFFPDVARHFPKLRQKLTMDVTSVDLYEGINMLALPLDPDTTVSSYGILNDVTGATVVTSWDGELQQFGETAMWIGETIVGVDFPFELGYGYFVTMDTTGQVSFDGMPLTWIEYVPIETGLDVVTFVGYPDTVTSYDLLSDFFNGNEVCRYNSQLQIYQCAIKIGENIIGDEFTLEEGTGYFVRQSSAGYFPTDNTPPSVTISSPTDSSEIHTKQPFIEIIFDDHETGLVLDSLAITINGFDKKSSFTIDSVSAIWQPMGGEELLEGENVIEVSIYDINNQQRYVTSIFDVVTIPPPTDEHFVNGYVFDGDSWEPMEGVAVTVDSIPGVIYTDVIGHYVFPTSGLGEYKIDFTKEHYAYAQRYVLIEDGHGDVFVDDAYLSLKDSIITRISVEGGVAVNSDGSVFSSFPHETVDDDIAVAAFNLDDAEDLPNDLPELSVFTYCVKFWPDEAEFNGSTFIDQLNFRGFASGTPIPVGQYNPETMLWEDEGMAYVQGDSSWFEWDLEKFMSYGDCNAPVVTRESPDVDRENSAPPDPDPCPNDGSPVLGDAESKYGGSTIRHDTPSFKVLGKQQSLGFTYQSRTAKPNIVIETSTAGIPPQFLLPQYTGSQLNIVGRRFTGIIEASRDTTCQNIRFDIKDSNGEYLPTGLYYYRDFLSNFSYSEYATADSFGGSPIASTGIMTDFPVKFSNLVLENLMVNNRISSEIGSGWGFDEMQRLYRRPDGDAFIIDGAKSFYYEWGPVTSEDMAGYWSFDEGIGDTAHDYSENSNNSILYDTDWVNGISGYAIYLDEDNDYISIPAINLDHSYTVAFWFFLTEPANGTILHRGEARPCRYEPLIHFYGNDTMHTKVSGCMNSGKTHDFSPVVSNVWHFLVFVVEPNTQRLFFDNTEILPVAHKTSSHLNMATVIGGAAGNTPGIADCLFIDHTIVDEVGFYNRALNESEIEGLYKVPGYNQRVFFPSDGDLTKLYLNHDSVSYTRFYPDSSKVIFDSLGFHLSSIDRNGNVTSYEYDEFERVISVTYPGSLVTYLDYGLDEKIETVTDHAGRITDFDHDEDGNLISITDPDSSLWQYEYDDEHLLTKVIDPRGNETVYEYDSLGYVTNITGPDSSVNIFKARDSYNTINEAIEQGYGTPENPAPVVRPHELIDVFVNTDGDTTTALTNRFGRRTQKTDVLGRIWKYEYDDDGRITSIIRPDSAVTSYTYDNYGNILTIIEESNGAITSYEYDSTYHQMTWEVNAVGDTTRYELDGRGNIIRIINPLNDTTFNYYDSLGLLIKTINANGDSTLNFYNNMGNVDSTMNELEYITKYEYDSAGNMTAEIDPLDNRTEYEYDANGRMILVRDPLGNETEYIYDPSIAGGGCCGNATNDLLLAVINPAGDTTWFDYDEMGRRISITDPEGNTSYTEYDTEGRITKEIDADGRWISFGYDKAGNLTTVTDSLGRVTTHEYDNRNRKKTSIDALGGITGYVYDGVSNLTHLINANGDTTSFTHDLMNRKTSETDLLNRIDYYSYNPLGLMDTLITPRGDTITNEYDKLGRLTEKQYPYDTLSYQYNAIGNPLQIDDSDSRLVMIYNSNGHLETVTTGDVTNPDNLQPVITIEHLYDDAGRKSAMVDPSTDTTYYSYDVNSELDTLIAPGGEYYKYVRDKNSRVTGIARPNSTTTSYDYDASGNLLSIVHRNGLTLIDSLVYSYNGISNIIMKTDESDTSLYGYDSLDQVIAADYSDISITDEFFTYDSVGNRLTSHLSTQYGYDEANQITVDDIYVYTFDVNGNMIEKEDTLTSDRWEYTFDSGNRLIEVKKYDGGISPPSLEVSYSYDGLDRRIAKIVNSDTTVYVYDGTNIHNEYDGSGLQVASYVNGLQIDQPLKVTRTGTDYYYHADRLGSIISLTDVNGDVAQTYRYDSFGNIISTLSQDYFSPYTYTGREWDEDVGLYYYRARYYDPGLGRFIAKDPIGLDAGDVNFYRYVGNNPINSSDPIGMKHLDPKSKAHTYRNIHNKCPWKIPKKPKKKCENNKDYTDYKGNRWEKDYSPYHGWYKGYKTFRGITLSGSQCTYDTNGNLIDTGKYLGTYDYYPPGKDYSKHKSYDVKPHKINPKYEPNLTQKY